MRSDVTRHDSQGKRNIVSLLGGGVAQWSRPELVESLPPSCHRLSRIADSCDAMGNIMFRSGASMTSLSATALTMSAKFSTRTKL